MKKDLTKVGVALLVFCQLLLGSQLMAAEVVSLRDLQPQVKKLTSQSTTFKTMSMANLFQLGSDVDFKAIKSEVSKKGAVHSRMQQYYKGLKVLNHQAVVVQDFDKTISRLHGYVAKGIAADIKTIKAKISEKAALKIVQDIYKRAAKLKKVKYKFENIETEKVIYIHKNKAKLAYRVTFNADSVKKGTPSRPVMVIDALTKEILHARDQLTFNKAAKATGPGGNEKTGMYKYGEDFPELEISEDEDGNCFLKTDNVITIDVENEGSGSPIGDSGLNTDPLKFDCYENAAREVNGSFGQTNDAHFFGTTVFKMYQDWFGLNPLKTDLTLRVHYGDEFENAFWDGKQMTFGDGKDILFPLAVLDVTAHEVSHGFTEFNSNLVYEGQSGGINEAFSDMAGEAAEFYARGGKNDFLIGGEVMKDRDALRYMKDPTKDGKSIDNVKDFVGPEDASAFECFFCQLTGGDCTDLCATDVHHSSGIFNKVFYEMSTAEGWDTKKAFEVFVKANKDYWSASTDFEDGAKGVIDAANDLEYDVKIIEDAFKDVGVKVDVEEDEDDEDEDSE